MGRSDYEMGRSDSEKWEGLTQKNGKVWLQKWKLWPGKVGRTDRKKWKSLAQKWVRLSWKCGKCWLEKLEELTWKSGKDSFKKWERLARKIGRSESKQGRSDSKTWQVWLKKGRSCWHLTAIVPNRRLPPLINFSRFFPPAIKFCE